MKHQINPNIANLILVAKALGPLRDKVVFIGGATTALYVDYAYQAAARPTIDVDCVIEISSLFEYQKLEEQMRFIGFNHDTSSNAPICRWIKDALIVDLMPTEAKILGFTNSWYKGGIESAKIYKLPNNEVVSIFSFEYFLASKCEALLSRGMKDLILSQDLEDILFVMDGRNGFFEELKSLSPQIKAFVSKAFKTISKHPTFESAARGNMPRGLSLERQNFLLSSFVSSSDESF